jgi:solute carrier family 25 (mitochondrial carnitine/acylcarnitine transporter), member 20/29
VTLVRTVSFSIYQRAKYTYDDWICRATGRSPLEVANTRGALPTLSTIACFGAAGATAGAAVTAIACPFELTKLSAQISVLMKDNHGSMDDPLKKEPPRISYTGMGTLKTGMTLVKHRGIMGLYSGFQLHLRKTL